MNQTVEPHGRRLLIRKDNDRKESSGGIILPDPVRVPVITGRVVSTSVEMEDAWDFPVKQYDRVLFDPYNAIPVDLEHGNVLYVVPTEDVVAVFRTEKQEDKVTT